MSLIYSSVIYVFCASQNVFLLLKINFHASCFLRLFCIVLVLFVKFLEPNRRFALKVDYDVLEGFIDPS
jgi:hypothetical protein